MEESRARLVGEEDLLLVLDVLREEGRDLVTEEGLVVPPEMPLDLDVTIGIELLVPDQDSQVLVLDVGHVLEDGHDDGSQLLDLDDGEALEEELLELLVFGLALHLVHEPDLVGELVPEVLQHRVVEVEPLDAVEVQQGQHGPQGRQQHPVLDLEVLDGLERVGAASEGLPQVLPARDPDLLQAEASPGPRHGVTSSWGSGEITASENLGDVMTRI